jgi:uncharacterized RDD family membrane protein YckC
MILFTAKKQGLHDLLAKTLVLQAKTNGIEQHIKKAHY